MEILCTNFWRCLGNMKQVDLRKYNRNLQILKLLKIQCLFTLSFHGTVACGRASITFGYLFLSKPLLNLIRDNLTCIVYRSKGVKQRCLPRSHWHALCTDRRGWSKDAFLDHTGMHCAFRMFCLGAGVVGATATEAAVLTLALCLVAANLHSLITTCPHEWRLHVAGTGSCLRLRYSLARSV